MKYPNGTEKPLAYEKLPAAVKAKVDAEMAAKKKAMASRHFERPNKAEGKSLPGAKKRKVMRIKNDDGPKRKVAKPKFKKERTGDDSDDDGANDAANAAALRRLAESRTPKDQAIAEFDKKSNC